MMLHRRGLSSLILIKEEVGHVLICLYPIMNTHKTLYLTTKCCCVEDLTRAQGTSVVKWKRGHFPSNLNINSELPGGITSPGLIRVDSHLSWEERELPTSLYSWIRMNLKQSKQRINNSPYLGTYDI